ncbi:MAG TPA: hypothetical protein VIS03_04810 [Kiloniellaceae bacterium]
MTKPSLRDVVERHRHQLLQVTGVAGVAAGAGRSDPQKLCIQVFVTTDQWPEGVSRQIEGYDVELVKTSGFRAE